MGKLVALGAFIGLCAGGLAGSALFGLHGGVVGSVVGILVGAGTLGIVARGAQKLDDNS